MNVYKGNGKEMTLSYRDQVCKFNVYSIKHDLIQARLTLNAEGLDIPHGIETFALKMPDGGLWEFKGYISEFGGSKDNSYLTFEILPISQTANAQLMGARNKIAVYRPVDDKVYIAGNFEISNPAKKHKAQIAQIEEHVNTLSNIRKQEGLDVQDK